MDVLLNAEQTALYKEQEDANYHTENLILLASVSGDFPLLDTALRLYRLREKHGSLNEWAETRDRLSEQLKPVFFVSPEEAEQKRIKKMVESWAKEKVCFSHCNKDDSPFFEAIGKDYGTIGTASQTGADIVYYETANYLSGSDAIRRKPTKSAAASAAIQLMDNDYSYMLAVELSVARFPESAATICDELELYI